MKTTLARLAVLTVVSAAFLVPSDVAAEPADRRGDGPLGTVKRVRMVDGERFRPRTLTVERGTKVRWVNKDNVDHTTTSSTGIWSRVLSPGERFTRRFRQSGTFDYRCTIHPRMFGTIVVT